MSNPSKNMYPVKEVLKYIIHLNIIISISASLLIAGVAKFFTEGNHFIYGMFGFFSTLFVYNGQRLFKANIETRTPWLKWVYNHRKLVFMISLISGLIASCTFLVLLNEITFEIILLLILGTIISYFYVVKIKGKSLREFPYLKIHLIALTWTLIIVLFPLLNENIYNKEILTIFVPAHYLYFLAIAIPFDIRDLKHDAITQKTIPQIIGLKKAKTVSVSLLIIATISLWATFSKLLFTPLFIASILIQILLIMFVTENHKEFYYSFLLDGGIALLGACYLISGTA